MDWGCVPIAYESYSSLSDIITNDKDGFCIQAFNEKKYLEKLTILMNNETLRKQFAIRGKQSVKRFYMDNIGEIWCQMLNDIVYVK